MRAPFLLRPTVKDYLWGGSRLRDEFGKDMDVSPLAESWECSTHPQGPSSLPTGEDLRDVLKAHPEWLGTHSLELTEGKPELPVLVKFIDAKEDLSIQVHPDDEYALREEGEPGKTEMWYVMDAAPKARILWGFHRDVSPEEVRSAIEVGDLPQLMNSFPVKKDQLYYIPAGTVHAIGAGTLIAEIQENSNLIYRLYDYDRVDKDGRKRPLHIDRALDVADLAGGEAPVQAMRVLRYRKGCASELLVRCRYFLVERLLLQTGEDSISYSTGSNTFHALLCMEGSGSITTEDLRLDFTKGDCLFIPADSGKLGLSGKAQLLDVSC